MFECDILTVFVCEMLLVQLTAVSEVWDTLTVPEKLRDTIGDRESLLRLSVDDRKAELDKVSDDDCLTEDV